MKIFAGSKSAQQMYCDCNTLQAAARVAHPWSAVFIDGGVRYAVRDAAVSNDKPRVLIDSNRIVIDQTVRLRIVL